MTRVISTLLLTLLLGGVMVSAQAVSQDKMRLARTYEEAGDLKNAARLYQELWDARPDVQLYFEGVVRTLMGLQQYAAVLPIIEKRLQTDPEEQLYIIAGVAAWHVGRTADAERWWNEATATSQMKEQTAVMLAQAQVSLGLTDMAIASYLRARTASEIATSYASELASLYAAKRDNVRATDEIMAFFASSKDVSGTQGRFAALMTDSATRVYIGDVLSRADDTDPSVLRLRQWYHRETKDLLAALADTRALDERLRSNGHEILFFADAMRREGQYDIALQAYGELMKRGTADASLLAATYGYTRTLQQRTIATGAKLSRSDAEMILQRYAEFLSKAPNHPYASDALLQMATIHDRDLDDLQGAVDHLTRLVNQYRGTPSAAEGSLYLAELWIVRGQLSAAATTLEELMRLSVPTIASQREIARVRRADLYRYSGSMDSAMELYREASAVPGSDAANDAFEKLMLVQLADQDSAALVMYDQAELLRVQRRHADAAQRYLEATSRAKSPELKDQCAVEAAEEFVESAAPSDATKALQPVLLRIPDSIIGDRALLIQATIEESAGQRTAAIATLTTILTQYPRSIYGPQVRDRIRRLRGDV